MNARNFKTRIGGTAEQSEKMVGATAITATRWFPVFGSSEAWQPLTIVPGFDYSIPMHDICRRKRKNKERKGK